MQMLGPNLCDIFMTSEWIMNESTSIRGYTEVWQMKAIWL